MIDESLLPMTLGLNFIDWHETVTSIIQNLQFILIILEFILAIFAWRLKAFKYTITYGQI